MKVKFVWENPWFMIPTLLFLIVGLLFSLAVPYGEEILWLNPWRIEPLNTFFRFCSALGEAQVYYVAGLLAMFVRYRFSALIALTGVIILPISYVLKDQIGTDRPVTFFSKKATLTTEAAQPVFVPGVFLNTGQTSFPSGHTTSAFAFYGLVAMFLPRRNRWFGLILAYTAILVGVARIFLVQHFLVDVLGGACLGLGIAWLMQRLNNAQWFQDLDFLDRKLGMGRNTAVVALLFLGQNDIFAQKPANTPGTPDSLAPPALRRDTIRPPQLNAASGTAQKPFVLEKRAPEEVLEFTFSLSPELSTPDTDTLPDVHARTYDPARRQILDWANLGNTGSSARPLFFQTTPMRGFDAGFHAFDLYQIRPEQLAFYRNARSFSDVAYSQGQTQAFGTLRTRFARTFERGFSFSLDFQNLNNLGVYRYGRAKQNALAVGGWLPIGTRYDGFFVFARNNAKQQENGGLSHPEYFSLLGTANAQVRDPIDLPVWLAEESALSRQLSNQYQFTQHFKLAGAARRDTSGRELSSEKRILRLSHQLTWGQTKHKFSDTEVSNDESTLFYGSFLSDERGLRRLVQVKNLENAVLLTTFKPKGKGKRADFLSAGISHTYFQVLQEPSTTRFSNFFLTGSLALTPSERLGLTAKGDLGQFKNFGEYRLESDLNLGLGKAGHLRGHLLAQRRPTSWLVDSLFVSSQQVWATNFKKPIETSLSATYALPSIGFEATGRTHLVNNFIFFGPDAQPKQASSALSVTQLLLRENFRIGPLHFDNTLGLQAVNDTSLLHLPVWMSKNSLYLSGKVFKKNMLLEAGVDFRMNAAFQPDAYMPLTGQFYRQDTFSMKSYAWLDAFVAFKVSNFRVFARFENLSALWAPTEAAYWTHRYPQAFARAPLPFFRIGIRWRFMDSNTPDEKSREGQPGQNRGDSPLGNSTRPPIF